VPVCLSFGYDTIKHPVAADHDQLVGAQLSAVFRCADVLLLFVKKQVNFIKFDKHTQHSMRLQTLKVEIRNVN